MASIQDMISDLRNWGIDMSGVRKTPDMAERLVKLILTNFPGAQLKVGSEWNAYDSAWRGAKADMGAAQMSKLRRDNPLAAQRAEQEVEDKFRREDEARAEEVLKGIDVALGRRSA